MKIVSSMIGMLLAGVWAAAAPAAETTINYQGTVVATPDPSQAFGLTVGSPIDFSVTFDPAKLTDASSTFYNIDAISGLPVAIPGLRTASLSDDPGAALTITAGSHILSKTDQIHYGTNALGAGNIPIVVYQGSTFAGVAFEGRLSDGFDIDVDPIALALHYFPNYGVGYDENSSNPDYGFLISTNLPALATAAVPEPASWAMMILGFGAIGFGMRHRRQGVRVRAV